jgi:hypothetical protein
MRASFRIPMGFVSAPWHSIQLIEQPNEKLHEKKLPECQQTEFSHLVSNKFEQGSTTVE